VEAACQEVLAGVVFSLLVIRQVAVAGIEALVEQKQATDAIAVLLEIARVGELLRVAFGMIRPDVFDLVTLTATLGILGVARCLYRLDLDARFFEPLPPPSPPPPELPELPDLPVGRRRMRFRYRASRYSCAGLSARARGGGVTFFVRTKSRSKSARRPRRGVG
jgi:hypothetical protein